MEPGFQAIVYCMIEAGWLRGEVMRSLRLVIAADNITRGKMRWSRPNWRSRGR